MVAPADVRPLILMGTSVKPALLRTKTPSASLMRATADEGTARLPVSACCITLSVTIWPGRRPELGGTLATRRAERVNLFSDPRMDTTLPCGPSTILIASPGWIRETRLPGTWASTQSSSVVSIMAAAAIAFELFSGHGVGGNNTAAGRRRDGVLTRLADQNSTNRKFAFVLFDDDFDFFDLGFGLLSHRRVLDVLVDKRTLAARRDFRDLQLGLGLSVCSHCVQKFAAGERDERSAFGDPLTGDDMNLHDGAGEWRCGYDARIERRHDGTREQGDDLLVRRLYLGNLYGHALDLRVGDRHVLGRCCTFGCGRQNGSCARGQRNRGRSNELAHVSLLASAAIPPAPSKCGINLKPS